MENQTKWYEKAGGEGDVVTSTRIRLARNLKAYPFPVKLSQKEKETIEEQVKAALLSGNSIMASEFKFIQLDTLRSEQAISLVEKHLISPEFISGMAGKALLLSKDETIAIMINEEDHLRIQVMCEGLALQKAYETIERIDRLLGETLHFAFDDELGYLTQCPTNLGTGMRASVMLQLPALAEYGAIPRMTANLAKLGIVIRGSYGEGTQVTGALYQLSNQVTLGLSEQEAISNLQAITTQLIHEERKTRKAMAESIAMQDKIDRAAGVLKSARILSTTELMNLTAYLRFGLSAGVIEGVTHEQLNKLVSDTQPATIMANAGKNMEQEERDILRAQKAREICKHIKE